MARKTMTLRLQEDQAAELEAVARADDVSVNEAVRVAIARHIDERRNDPDFQARVKSIVERELVVLKRLAQ